jgi:hypothetical protein
MIQLVEGNIITSVDMPLLIRGMELFLASSFTY